MKRPNEPSSCAYPFAVVHLEGTWNATALQWQAALAADSSDELHQLMAEQVALRLHDEAIAGHAPEQPLPEQELDVTHYREEGQAFDIVYVTPAPLSTAAVAIERALAEDGVSQAELARRMGVPPSSVSRIADPLYFGHTTNTLRAVAEALGRELRIELVAPRGDHGTPARQRPRD